MLSNLEDFVNTHHGKVDAAGFEKVINGLKGDPRSQIGSEFVTRILKDQSN